MLTLINANRVQPLVAPIGLDYVAAAARAAKIQTDVLDLALETDPRALEVYFSKHTPRLVGVTFRNLDDCFWPSCHSYLPDLVELVQQLRRVSDAPIVLGGVGLSLFVQRLTELSGADFGIRGDGEEAIVSLYTELGGARDWSKVPGLCFRRGGEWISTAAAWPEALNHVRPRDAIDNRAYYLSGGQGGIESKRGCPRRCIYCADPNAKGRRVRCRAPDAVAEEAAALLAQGVETLHFCDGEFNVPRSHAMAVCDALVARGLQQRLRFYVYAAVRPFDAEFAHKLKLAGCAGINFTADSADPEVLLTYRAAHRFKHLAECVRLCREVGITCMLDLLLGGPAETPESLTHTLRQLQALEPDCVGAGLGMRLYPDTPVIDVLTRLGVFESMAGIKRHYQGPLDLIWPTFYVAPALGPAPSRLIQELIGNDARFFPPVDEHAVTPAADHNYNDNSLLRRAIEGGARGAYWDVLRRARGVRTE